MKKPPDTFGSGRIAIAADTDGLIRLVGMMLPGNGVRNPFTNVLGS